MNPQAVAYLTVLKLMEQGIAQGHADGAWADEDKRMHCLKAIRHLTTYLLILDGHTPDNGENHAENALCRTSFILAQDYGKS
jgi:hypothetical protein